MSKILYAVLIFSVNIFKPMLKIKLIIALELGNGSENIVNIVTFICFLNAVEWNISSINDTHIEVYVCV